MVNSEDIIILKMVEEVRLQCEFAMIAYTDIVQMLKGEYLLEAEKSFSEALERRNQITQDANYLPEDLDQALDAVKQALKNKTDIMDRANVRLFYSIHALVTATANISKLFWFKTARKKEDETSKKLRVNLRNILSIDHDDSKSIFGNRNVRNALEHFDREILKKAKLPAIQIFDLSIGPASMFANIDKEAYIRVFDTTSFTISAWGNDLNLLSLMQTITDVWERTKKAKEVIYQKIFPTPRG